MIERPAPARVKSLVGTARRMKIRNQKKLNPGRDKRIPCRPSGIWACIGTPERFRSVAQTIA